MDAREEISRWLALLVQLSNEAESDQINADIKMLTGVTQQLSSELAKRNSYLAKQCRPRKSKPPKSDPVTGPQKVDGDENSRDAPNAQNDSEDRSKELSAIQQGIHQADPPLADQQRLLRGKIYGAQNNDVQFRKAAKAIAR